MTGWPRLAPTGFLLLLLAAGTARPDSPTQEEVERRLAELGQEISALQEELEANREHHRREQAQLRDSDLQIQETHRHLRELADQEKAHQDELAVQEKRRQAQVLQLEVQGERLARQIEATYRLGRESRVKLLLNQDSPARLSRLLGYYDRINRAQAVHIRELRTLLHELEATLASIDAELRRIDEVQTEQQQALEVLETQRMDRSALIEVLAGDIEDQQQALAELQRNQEDLEKLLERLSNALADIPADLGSRLGVAEQKGKLPMPIAGKVLHAFGQRRAAGMNWQGWLIDARPASEVRNVAYGRVAFADWLRGYGLLMIIDHGQGFLSLYGYNESLLWDVGDWVDAGETIATVGGAPGGEQGLYFELRKDGQAIDPAAWLKR